MEQLARPLSIIESEIHFYKTQTATVVIEIGKRLIEAKAQLQHGEWGKWLQEKVEFSQWTANKLMKCAEEISNCGALNNLPQTKVFALLDIPAEEREQFIQQKHEVNGTEKTVDDMTTRELQKVITEKKAVEDKLRQTEEELREERENKAVQTVETVPADYLEIKQKLSDYKKGKEKLQTVEVMPDDYLELQQKVVKYEKEISENEEKVFESSKILLEIEMLNIDYNAKLLSAASRIEEDLGAGASEIMGLYKCTNETITQSVHKRLTAMFNNLENLLKVLSTGLNLDEAKIIEVEKIKKKG